MPVQLDNLLNKSLADPAGLFAEQLLRGQKGFEYHVVINVNVLLITFKIAFHRLETSYVPS